MRDIELTYRESVDLAKGLADNVVQSTEKPVVGILALLMAAAVLAKITGWDQEKLEEGFRAALDASYHDMGHGPTLNA